jgi:polysaccharide biosynthesis protein PslG
VTRYRLLISAFMATLAALVAGAFVWGGGPQTAASAETVHPCSMQEFGLHMDLTWAGRTAGRELVIDRVTRTLHPEISRNTLRWEQIEPTRGKQDWTLTDDVVDELRNAGVEPLFVVMGSPSWARSTPVATPSGYLYVPPPGASFDRWLAEYAGFVGEAASRYRGKVRKWEIWNEPNLAAFWRPRPNVDEYARLYTTLRRAIVRQDPDAKVALGGLTAISVAAGGDTSGLKFLRALNARDVFPDIVALHPYTSDDHAPNEHQRGQNNFDDIRRVRAYLASIGHATPIWVTEWGWSTASIPPATQARYVATSLSMIRRAYPYVRVATLFLDYDRPPTFYNGLLDASLRPKAAARAFSSFIRSLPVGRCPPRAVAGSK